MEVLCQLSDVGQGSFRCVIRNLVGRKGIEPPQSKTADLQSAELTTCSTYPRTALTLRDAMPRGEENDLRSFLFYLEPTTGLEPGTGGSQNRCSTN